MVTYLTEKAKNFTQPAPKKCTKGAKRSYAESLTSDDVAERINQKEEAEKRKKEETEEKKKEKVANQLKKIEEQENKLKEKKSKLIKTEPALQENSDTVEIICKTCNKLKTSDKKTAQRHWKKCNICTSDLCQICLVTKANNTFCEECIVLSKN